MSGLTSSLERVERGVSRVAARFDQMPATEVMLARMLMHVGSALTVHLEQVLRPHGLNESDFRTLMQLFSSPDGTAFPSELCQFATQTPTNMTRIVDGLVQRGWVSRRTSEQDRRRIVLQVTSQGETFVREMLPVLFPHVRSAFAGLSAGDQRKLGGLLHQVAQSIDRANPGKRDE